MCGAVYLTTDDVIAAQRETMDDTIAYINKKYGNVATYLKEVSSFSVTKPLNATHRTSNLNVDFNMGISFRFLHSCHIPVTTNLI